LLERKYAHHPQQFIRRAVFEDVAKLAQCCLKQRRRIQVLAVDNSNRAVLRQRIDEEAY
jgi:hypothetical protein